MVSLQALIFYLSSQPQIPVDTGLSDKVLHFAAYGLLSALWIVALAGSAGSIGAAKAWGGAVLAVLFGLSDEFHQSFVPGRTASWGDVAADALGAAVAAGALWLLAARRGEGKREERAARGV